MLPPGQYWMVDDERELVLATVSMLGREVGANNVRGTTDSREAAEWIDRERPTALITDVRMPHLTGLELVTRLHARWGPVPVVVVTAFPTAQVDQDARSGRFAYLPKPFAFNTLRDTLGRICNQPAPSAFSGAIAVTMLAEVVQLYGLANRTGLLRVDSPEGTGEIGFDSGRVVDARTASHSGVEAFNAILSWSSGKFGWASTPPQSHTINQGLAELLIDAYRLRDEQAGGTPVDGSADDFSALDRALDPQEKQPGIEQRSNVVAKLNRLEHVDGFLAAALFDIEARSCVAAVERDGTVKISAAAGGHAELVEAKLKTIARLALNDNLEDIVISLRQQYHLLRLCRRQPRLFFMLALDRGNANLAMARYVLSDVEKDIVL
jgi:CheY-like chemotaxis protein